MLRNSRLWYFRKPSDSFFYNQSTKLSLLIAVRFLLQVPHAISTIFTHSGLYTLTPFGITEVFEIRNVWSSLSLKQIYVDKHLFQMKTVLSYFLSNPSPEVSIWYEKTMSKGKKYRVGSWKSCVWSNYKNLTQCLQDLCSHSLESEWLGTLL